MRPQGTNIGKINIQIQFCTNLQELCFNIIVYIFAHIFKYGFGVLRHLKPLIELSPSINSTNGNRSPGRDLSIRNHFLCKYIYCLLSNVMPCVNECRNNLEVSTYVYALDLYTASPAHNFCKHGIILTPKIYNKTIDTSNKILYITPIRIER